jgi:hypothetical protein
MLLLLRGIIVIVWQVTSCNKISKNGSLLPIRGKTTISHVDRGTAVRGRGFFEGDTLSEWKASRPNSLLWIHGKCQWPLTTYFFAETDGFPSS